MTKIHSELNAASSNKWLLKEASEQTAGSVVMLGQAGGYWNTQQPLRQFNLHWRQIIAIWCRSPGSWKVPCAAVGAELGLHLQVLLKCCLHQVGPCIWSEELKKAGSWVLLDLKVQHSFLTAAGAGTTED